MERAFQETEDGLVDYQDAVVVWDLLARQQVAELAGAPLAPIKGVFFAPDSRRLLVSRFEGSAPAGAGFGASFWSFLLHSAGTCLGRSPARPQTLPFRRLLGCPLKTRRNPKAPASS